ncbi:hypothetical protein SOVF_025370 [Spinacia oleracea]|uniref:DUF7780 domain-containing protein n=1 Tax=Spinacia oleracea TaxID=3562 RepID=A0A9R0JLT1_SPIOL|nr:uncharacterized protein LOC110779208 [Spinacia oleracea]KNA23380.1 hypothetical protein SOVF_025370 [Spinacia oleracea]
MVFSAKSNDNEGWGMGFLLILFHHHPENHEEHSHFKKKSSPSISLAAKSTNLLLSKTQSTLSICGILVFTTILLFTLSTFEPSSFVHHHSYKSSSSPSRRFLRDHKENDQRGFEVLNLFSHKLKGSESNITHIASNSALQGMGALYLRGSKSMTDLVVAHVAEDVTENEFKSFLRVVINHSGLLSRSDFVFIFASPSSAARFGGLVKLESDSFLRLVRLGCEIGRVAELGVGFSRYLVKREFGEGEKEPMWGRKRGNSSEGELTRSSYGSVVGFEASELDPEDTLSGFLDHVPMSLRRWASYPMLLGRVRRQFKHVMLVDVKSTLILSDPFSRVRNRSSESLFLWSNLDAPEPTTRHHGKRNSGKARDLNSKESKPQLNPAVIVGGSRGVRRFATAALTEIVRGVIEHKGKGRNSVTESGLVNQLVHSGHLLKKINLITPAEPLAKLSSLAGFNSVDTAVFSYLKLSDYFSVVQRGHSGGGSGSLDIDEVVMREICASHKLYSSVYSDCLASQ